MTALAAILLTVSAASAKTLTLKYPEKYCAEILSQEYSTGGGDSAFQFVEILCRDAEGNYRGFMVRMGSAAGFFGAGRLVTPKTIIYVPWSGNTLEKG